MKKGDGEREGGRGREAEGRKSERKKRDSDEEKRREVEKSEKEKNACELKVVCPVTSVTECIICAAGTDVLR